MKFKIKEDEEQPEERRMSVYSAYRAGKITKDVYQKYFKDGYNVKTTLITI